MMLEKPKPTRMLTRMMAAIEAPSIDADQVKDMLRPAAVADDEPDADEVEQADDEVTE